MGLYFHIVMVPFVKNNIVFKRGLMMNVKRSYFGDPANSSCSNRSSSMSYFIIILPSSCGSGKCNNRFFFVCLFVFN